MTKRTNLAAILGLAIAAAAPAAAAPAYYIEPIDFISGITGPFSYESFEDLVSADFYSLTFASTTVSFDNIDFARSQDHVSDGHYSIATGLVKTTFNFAAPVTAFGIDVIDLGTTGPQDFYVGIDGKAPFLLLSHFQASRFTKVFAGVIDAAGFSSVTLYGALQDDVIYYDLQRTIAYVAPMGGVPEPATWALLITGFGAVGSAMRGRRGTKVAAA